MANTLSLFDSPPHPLKPRMKLDWSGTMTKPTSRTKRPVKYYFIDFDLSRMYEPEEHRLETPPWGGDKTVPEFLIPNPEPCDPFPVDVYCLGNAIRRSFLDGYEEFFVAQTGLEFMRELITDMVKDDPKARPTMAEVVERFDKIVQGLSSWRLRSPVVRVDKRLGFFGSAAHWIKQLCYMARRLPAIPKA
ncbi:hypothetical protein H0H81_006310 [Sphagnurus paluster]|uniref:Protein kinase domain-containing protein n=1 Tax=Sphagnurus paluster TaxID=117069 RepID=A0A9P7KH02_9AGAR|nr:hypothetical protein H0H81_006310 [Sphagnurus paluster]